MNKPFTYLTLLAFFMSLQASAQTKIQGLLTQGTVTPLGIDDRTPAFTWQMSSPERGMSQSAYQLVVTDPSGKLLWDSKKVRSSSSLNTLYAGSTLRPSTRYQWKVTVWDQKGAPASATSWFETGLMNPDPGLSAWNGATWIGGGDQDLVLFAQYLSIYKLKYTQTIQEGSTKASFIIGANDPRLLDKYKNTYQVQNKPNQSYVKLELDVSDVSNSLEGKAKLHVYRAGYTDKDDPGKPLRTFEVLPKVINTQNKHQAHTIEVSCLFGEITLALDGQAVFAELSAATQDTPPGPPRAGGPRLSVNLNPMGSGGNYTTFGMLGGIGFALPAGQKATFAHVTVSNTRAPGNVLFSEALTKSAYKGIFSGPGLTVAEGTYQLDGGAQGVFIVGDPSRNAMPLLRTQFSTAAKRIDHARLYATARGIYELYLNGSRVGTDYFNPGLTQYPLTHLYQTYDVTNLVRSGNNALGAMLGEGWWSGLLSFGSVWNHFGDRQSLLAKLVITYADGTTDVVTTNNKSWTYSNQGPIVYSSLDLGEIYDATKEAAMAGWTTATYNDNGWKAAVTVPLEGTAFQGTSTDFLGRKETVDYQNMKLIGQIGTSAGVYQTLTARSVQQVRPGVFVYDMGQNFVGVPRVTFAGGKAGQKVTFRVAEMLYPDRAESGKNVGMVMLENYRAALCQDVYTMKEGHQVFQPRFTSRGYQYLEITGIDAPLPLEAVQGVVISSVLTLTANYETSNPRVNKLWSSLVWSNIDNFLSIPTDCPQRNERMGWSGDINVFSPTATYVSNAEQFLRRHMYAMRDVQLPNGRFTDIAPVGGGFGGVLWGSAGIVIPWQLYLQYNNRAALEENYPAMARYIQYLATTINKETGISSDGALGDWLGPQNNLLGSAYLVTAYHIYDLSIMLKIARLLGKNADAETFAGQLAERRQFFNTKFVNADHKTLGLIGGRGFFGGQGGTPPPPPTYKLADSQTSYAVGLALKAFSEENVPFMVDNLAQTVQRKNADDAGVTRGEYALMTGFIGTAWINKALSDHGYPDLSYRLLQNNQYPSWLYAIDQGATTIWERLNGYTKENGFGGNNSMNSFNHYSFGAVGEWMMGYSLGIQRDEQSPGFKHVLLRPEYDPTGQMSYAKGYYDSMYGRIESGWKVTAKTLTYTTSLPANTTATLYLPAASEKVVKEGGKAIRVAKGVRLVKYEEGKAVYELGSGTYTFTAPLSN